MGKGWKRVFVKTNVCGDGPHQSIGGGGSLRLAPALHFSHLRVKIYKVGILFAC